MTSPYDNRYLLRLEQIGRVHVELGVKMHQVNAAMHFVRDLCARQLTARMRDCGDPEGLATTLHKVLDINLAVMTASFREEEMRKVFLSYTVESHLVRWSGRLLHGLNLVLIVGLLALALGVAGLLGYDIVSAFTHDFEHGVIKALGSLLVLWMMIELLHTEIEHLRGGKFHVRIFVELAMVAFIRKLFVASFEHKDAVTFLLLLGGLLSLGIIYFFVVKNERV